MGQMLQNNLQLCFGQIYHQQTPQELVEKGRNFQLVFQSQQNHYLKTNLVQTLVWKLLV